MAVATKKVIKKLKPKGSSPAQRLATKSKARAALVQAHGLPRSGRIPIVALITAGADPAFVSTLQEGLEQLTIHLVELADSQAAELAGCDIAIFAATELVQGRTALDALAVGTVPVLYEHSAPLTRAIEYDPTGEQGNSFYFCEENPWSVFAAVVRATETYRFHYDWAGIVRNTLG